MLDFVNPKGRILVFEEMHFIHEHSESFATISVGLASKAQLKALNNAPAVEEGDEPNPPLELWLNNELIGLCYLRIGTETASDTGELLPGELDTLYYSAEFEHIWIEEKWRGHGLGLLLAHTAARYTSSRIAEDFAENVMGEATVMFFATLVSERGDDLYSVFMANVETQLDMIAGHLGKGLTYTNEGGW